MKLNLGCGNNIKEGYINIDVYDNPNVKKCDIRDLGCFENESADEIYARDVIEHLTLDDAKKALKEWIRVLKHGGAFFIQTVNLDKQIEAYQKGVWSLEDFNYMVFAGINWSDGCVRSEDFHKSTFTIDSLKNLLNDNGINIISVNCDEIDQYIKANARWHNLTVMIEGTKI